jgi:hypothetical protein
LKPFGASSWCCIMLSEWVNILYLQNEQIFSSIMARRSYISMRIPWCSLFSRPTCLVGFYTASSQTQQSESRHVASLQYIILIPSQTVFRLLFKNASLAEKQQIPNLLFLLWPDCGSNPRYITLEMSSLSITPSMPAVQDALLCDN